AGRGLLAATAAAVLPPGLVSSTVRAATGPAAGEAAVAGAVPANAALSRGVGNAMSMTRVKGAALVVLAVCLAGGGTGVLAHLVRPDGTVGLGRYGAAHVAGLTTGQAAGAIADRLTTAGAAGGLSVGQVRRGLRVEVVHPNSKVCYVIVDSAGQGQQVYRLPL